jgi:hypothetical protein
MTRVTCFACKGEGKETLVSTTELRTHLEKIHGITRNESGQKITTDIEPMSVQVKLYQEQYAPNRFHFSEKNEKGEEQKFEVSSPPMFMRLVRNKKTKLPELDSKWVMLGYFKNYVVQLEVNNENLEFIPNENYTKFSLPMGFHQFCMSCPFGFERGIYNLKDVKKNYPILNRVKPQELEVLRFRCILRICEGVAHRYKEKILKFEPAWDEKGEIYEDIKLFEDSDD